MIIVYTDFKPPAAYLAFTGTLELARELGVPVEWRPCRGAGRPAPTQVKDQTVTANHLRARSDTRRAMHMHYARVQGLTMNWPETDVSSDLALGALSCIDDDPEQGINGAR